MDINRFIAWYTIGWSTANESTRNINQFLVDNGWQAYIDKNIVPVANTGIRRFLLHNPFGCQANINMQFSQYIYASKMPVLKKVCDTFVPAWKSLIEKNDIEVIAYLGYLVDDLVARRVNDAGKLNLMLAVLSDSLRPLVNAGIRSIALDAAVSQPYISVTHGLAIMLRSMGYKVYVEANPPRGHRHWAHQVTGWTQPFVTSLDWPVMALDYWYFGHGTNDGWNIPEADLSEVTLLMTPPDGETWNTMDNWMPTRLQSWWKNPKYKFAVSGDFMANWIKQGKTFAQLVGEV